jgi:uncharacterized repeat protein (TIGR03803 family)
MNNLRSVMTLCIILVFCATTGIAKSSKVKFKTVTTFSGKNGSTPLGALIQGLDGNLYGVTQTGGSCCFDRGTIFRMTPAGKLTLLYSFGADYDFYPQAGMTLGIDGIFYGTTADAGSGSECGEDGGCGSVFSLATGNTFTNLINFDYTDGWIPSASMVETSDGTFYGTTLLGGSAGNGTVFSITPSGALATIYNFSGADGTEPFWILQASNGNFYGITVTGGANDVANCEPGAIAEGCGTIFTVTPSGSLTTIYSFCSLANCADGSDPSALLQALDGNFYGTTAYGGTGTSCSGGCGTVFVITPAGGVTTLHDFDGSDGGFPTGLIQATDGNLYGVTYGGGTYGSGTIFKITTAGTFTSLYTFDGEDGLHPEEALLQATNGILYGTTYSGGKKGSGTAFSLSVGLGPFVATLPKSGSVGSTVFILGNSLNSATAVSFNGTTASFVVVSPTELMTTVPAGATTGTITVTLATGKLASNIPFLVSP